MVEAKKIGSIDGSEVRGRSNNIEAVMPSTTGESRTATASYRAVLFVALLAIAAHLPSLGGQFLFDDGRFILENQAVHELTAAGIVSYFGDPTTVASTGGDSIYRPLRTLDFAIDWAVSGGSPWFFHLRNVLYHALGAVLVLVFLRRLIPGDAALWGAALFAVHPVHVESVAWISSRGDLLLLPLFLGALLFHQKGRLAATCVLLVLALLAKETAAVFIGAALVVDLFRRARIQWMRYAVYAAITGTYLLLWLSLTDRGDSGIVGQTPLWLGGSRAGAAVTAARSLVYYVKLLLLPVELVNDYYVPARIEIDAGAVISMILLAGIIAVAIRVSRTGRFALSWGLVTLLPVLGIVVPMIIPTAERFLLLPAVGFCLWAGGLLARTRLRYAVLACMIALTVQRTLDWRSEDTLWQSTLEVAETPQSLVWRSRTEFNRYLETGDPEAGKRVVATAIAFQELFKRDIQVGVGDGVRMPAQLSLPIHIRALIASGHAEEAVDVAYLHATKHGQAEGHYLASLALEAMGSYEEAASAARDAYAAGFRGVDIPRRIEYLLARARGR